MTAQWEVGEEGGDLSKAEVFRGGSKVDCLFVSFFTRGDIVRGDLCAVYL